jgi:hypothetical protein
MNGSCLTMVEYSGRLAQRCQSNKNTTTQEAIIKQAMMITSGRPSLSINTNVPGQKETTPPPRGDKPR